MRSVRLNVNGRVISETIEPRTHLADLLRERLNLTATHLRCEQGVCGACTLLIDGQPARSCITYAVMCDGAEITTLEGLEEDAIIVALRRTFSEEHGLQCGYCTPGMLMTARDIILRLPDADPARVRTELSGNLCRCTGYVGIVRSISRGLDQQRRGALQAVALAQNPLGPIGARTARPAERQATLSVAMPTNPATPLLTVKAVYAAADDVPSPQMPRNAGLPLRRAALARLKTLIAAFFKKTATS
jgi:aerobic carbon-monoxide dehydrogenase small subunit